MTRPHSQPDPPRRGPDYSVLADMAGMACQRLLRPRTLPGVSRVLGEGLGPVRRLLLHARNNQEIRRVLDSGADVTFISSFFRSGNTWTRCLLADILLQNRGVQTSTAHADRTGEIVPDIYCDSVARRAAGPRDPLLVKTHENFDAVARSAASRGHRRAGEIGVKGKVKVLYLFRSPEDALVSYYHFRLLESPVIGRWTDLESFCQAEFSTWVQHVSSYLQAADHGASVFFMSYERLLRDTVESFGSMLRWLELDHSKSSIERAVCNMQFGKLRAREEARRKDAKEYFFRNGRQGSGATELSPESVRKFRDGAAALLTRVEKRALDCQSESSQPGKAARILDITG